MVTQNNFLTVKENRTFLIFFRLATALDLNKCFTKIKLTISLSRCSPISMLAPDISTMVNIMALILDGNADHVAHVCWKGLLGGKI